MRVSRRSSAQPPLPSKELQHLLDKHVKGLLIDEKKIQAHVMRPQNIVGVFSDRGPEEGNLQLAPSRFNVGNRLALHLDVNAFGAALHNALKDSIAGYTVRLRRNGQTIYTKDWQWAKTPQDGSESWTPDVPMHVASVSKLVTAMAMTLLMSERNISPDAQIIDYLPDYWS
jgi:hypothetical protein